MNSGAGQAWEVLVLLLFFPCRGPSYGPRTLTPYETGTFLHPGHTVQDNKETT